MGEARRILADKEKTTIIDGKGSKKDIETRVKELKVLLGKTDSEFDKEKLQERLAKLGGGIGVIKVGAATEIELKERKHRIEDALNATKAAVDEGIVPGGGVALLLAAKALEHLKSDNPDEATGIKIIKNVLSAPMMQIAINAGKDGAVVVDKVLNSKAGVGYDAEKDRYVDMVEAGIIDPKKVVRSEIENAASVAAIFLTMESAVCDIPEEKKEGGGGHGHGMGDMM